jgi:subtilase family serine protease
VCVVCQKCISVGYSVGYSVNLIIIKILTQIS